MELCHHCEKLGNLSWGEMRDELEETHTNFLPYYLHPSEEHFYELRDIVASSSNCPLCLLFLELFVEANGLEVLKAILYEPCLRDVQNLRISRTYSDNFNSMWLQFERDDKTWSSLPLGICLETDPAAERAIWKASSPSHFDQSVPVLQEWLRDCAQHHSDCAVRSNFLPKRLIRIDPLSDHINPRIVPGEDSMRDGGKYLALSHCWGKSQMMLKTTNATLADFTVQIPMSSLPNTYKDAFTVAKSIGIPYLWIDSLCIIQDDEADWHFQSAEMASIYRNAYLTIAAAASDNSDGGCFQDRKPSTVLDFPESHWHYVSSPRAEPYGTKSSIPRPRNIPKFRGFVRRLPLVKDLILQSPLNERAWTFQETTLSKRVIYFTKDQLIWRCQEGFRSEDGYLGKKFALDHEHVRSSSYDLYNKKVQVQIRTGDPRECAEIHDLRPSGDPWWEWVHDYSSRKLSYIKDRYAAFAGISVFYQDLNGCSIIAGLRSTHLPEDLLWIRSDSNSSHRFTEAPSWSWLSLNGPVRALSPQRQKESPNVPRERLEIEFIDHKVHWSKQPLTSWIYHGRIRLRGRISEAILGGETTQSHSTWGGDRSDYYALGPTPHIPGRKARSCNGMCVFDTKAPRIGEIVFCLLITENYSKSFEYSWNVLVLQPFGKDGNRFRRIGVGVISDSFIPAERLDEVDFFDEVEPEVVTLV